MKKIISLKKKIIEYKECAEGVTVAEGNENFEEIQKQYKVILMGKIEKKKD